MTHLVGQQLGRYTILEEIGRGGMARVYRAMDTLLKRTVALKVLAPQLAVDPEFARRFEREAITAANLRHPNIVTIYDVGEQSGLRYIAMEFVRGRTLHAIIEERGALGLGYAVAIVGPVAAALDYAHDHDAVHRDVKPQNIMIDADGRVLLTDFGIAQAPEGDGERLTRTGIFMGTPEYISPEQASAQRVDGRSDLYSLGIATYEIITGKVPFSGATPQLIVAHAQKVPPPPSTIAPSQPDELDIVLGRILAKRPESRYANGAAFVEALRIVARRHAISPPSAQQLARLVPPQNSSAGQATVSLGRGQTPPGVPAPLVGPPLATPPRPDERTEIGSAAPPARTRPPAPGPSPAPRPRPPAPALPPDGDDPFVPSPIQPDTQPTLGGGGGMRIPWTIAGPILGGLFLLLLFVMFGNRPVTPAPTVTATPKPLAEPAGPTMVTNTPTPSPTATPIPTEPPAATATPIEDTPTPIEPTEPPTSAPVEPTKRPPPPTEPPPPPPTDAPTEIPTEAPTLTPTLEITPTLTPTPTATAPPTETPTAPAAPTAVPTPAVTPSPVPTATALVSPPSPTGTPSPTETPSATLEPTLTLTLEPTVTETPATTPISSTLSLARMP